MKNIINNDIIKKSVLYIIRNLNCYLILGTLMIKLKRLFILILSLTFTVFLSVGVLSVKSFNVKGATNETNTTMFMPASRLEFYELKAMEMRKSTRSHYHMKERVQGLHIDR